MNIIPILKVGNVLIAAMQAELKDSIVDLFQQEILNAIQHSEAKGLIIDISSLLMVDTYTAKILIQISKMAKLLGTNTVLAGIKPEIAATLVRMGYLLPEVKTVLDLEEGLRILGVIPKKVA